MARVRVRPLAEADVAEAAAWYDAQESGVGPQFVAAIEVLLAQIAEFPASFPVVHRGLRRALVRRFPYAVYYRLQADLAEVIACTHVRRHRRVWRSRDA
jgi:plasmid stabilization system protein ParE